MKVLHISAYDRRGGAALAAYRLHRAMLRQNCDSSMLVGCKDSRDGSIATPRVSMRFGDRIRRYLERRRVADVRRRYAQPLSRVEIFSDDRGSWSDNIQTQIRGFDVLQLHWVSQFVNYRPFFRAVPAHVPIVWRLADMNPLTGGCHYDGGCGRFAEGCGQCPKLESAEYSDWSHHIWQRKKAALDGLPENALHLVALNNWMASQVKRSGLLRRFECSVIPNGVDLEDFRPINPTAARQALGIPEGRKVLALVAESLNNERKGFRLLLEAVERLASRKDLFLLLVGRGQTKSLPHPHINVESVESPTFLRQIYSAAGVFVIPSLEDNQPNTVLEAMACGTPVIGFKVGGVAEMVEDGRTGLLASQGNTEDLARAIGFLLDNESERARMGLQARMRVESLFSREEQVQKYLTLYSRLLVARGANPRVEESRALSPNVSPLASSS